MDEPEVGLETGLPEGGAGEPGPASIQDELRKLQSVKDREIAELRARMEADNQRLAGEVETLRRQQVEAQIRSIEDPDERAKAVIAEERTRLEAERRSLYLQQEMRSRPIVMAMISQQYGVPAEVLSPARTAVEMENLALRWKLEHAGKELEETKKKAEKPAPPAAAGQKFAAGAGQATSSYDPNKFRGTGDIAGSLRAKREAGL